jgi:SET domain-containing protein
MFDFHPDFKMYADKAQEHEAAYDAYMTGVVFASIAKQKEVIHEFHGILERNDNYQKLMRKKYDAQGYDERNSIMDSIDALSDEVMKS